MVNRQLRLFEKEKELPTARTPAFTKPIQDGEHMSIHGLIYGAELVGGWLEVIWLAVYHPPYKRQLAKTAWVHPDTIRSVHTQDFGSFSWAWGFGPEKNISQYQKEMGYFHFADSADYKWVEEILARKAVGK